jgi:hypothetical protein
MEDTSATRREVAEATVSPRMEDTSATREAAAAWQRKSRARRITFWEEDEEASAMPKRKKEATSSVAVAATNVGECFPPGLERCVLVPPPFLEWIRLLICVSVRVCNHF